MSLFLIPVTLCEGYAFWWGHGQAGKGVRWMAWERLCMPKRNGGLGVRNLKKFNLAMLAKQGWRILNESNTLVAAIMKAKYFPTTDFLSAQLGSNPSYVWRSIMSAQEIVKMGTRRKIGNGAYTKFWFTTVGANMAKRYSSYDYNEEFWELQQGTMSAFGVKASAINLLHEWREAQVLVGGGNQNVVAGVRVWVKPPFGWVNVNVDAAIFQNGYIGVGCVMRDTSGQFLGARCMRIEGAWRPQEAEAIGLREALSWVKEKNITCCVFETDSKNLADACNGIPGEAYFGTIVSYCISIMKHIDQVLVSFAYRSANMVAHVLAKATYSMSDIGEWHVTPPDFIEHVLHIDNV
ncbi:hypothetical protein AgCh_032534 [Apium graveolens]